MNRRNCSLHTENFMPQKKNNGVTSKLLTAKAVSFKRNMRNKVQHIHIFSGRFTQRPQLGNIFSCIYICISNIATVWTGKVLAVPITNRFAHIAGFAGKFGVNHNKKNTSKFSLIFKERTQLSKSPRVVSSPLCISNSGSFPDVGQVFNSNTNIKRLGFLYDLFCYRVIGNSCVSLFSALKPSQKLFTSSRAFALNTATHFEIFISNFIQTSRTKKSSIGKSSNVGYTKIHSYKFFNIFNIFFRDFYSLEKIKLAFLCNKVSFSFDIRKIFRIMADKRNFKPSINRPDGNFLTVLLIGKNTSIISNCTKRLKIPFLSLIRLIGINNLTNTSNKGLSGKSGSIFDFSIYKVVKSKLVESFGLPSYIRNLIAGFVTLFNGIHQRFSLLVSRQKSYLQSKFHSGSIYQMFDLVKQNHLERRGRFLRRLKQAVSTPRFL